MKGYLALGLFVLSATACGGSEPTAPTPPAPIPPVPAPSSEYAGRWSGTLLVSPASAPASPDPATVSQPFSFTVAANRVTEISMGYNFNGCSGVKTLSGLTVAIATSPLSSEVQGWGYGFPTSNDRTMVLAAFTSAQTATGQVYFIEFPACGSGFGTWRATKQ